MIQKVSAKIFKIHNSTHNQAYQKQQFFIENENNC